MATTKKFKTKHPKLVEQTVMAISKMGKNPEGHKILMSLYKIDAMTKAHSKEYEPVRAAARVIKIIK